MNIFTKAFWLQLSTPKNFYPIAGKLIPWFLISATLLAVIGLYYSFFVAPVDYQQGNSYRILFIHVPTAWMSMFIYVVMCIYAILGLVLKTRLSDWMALALAPTGAAMTFLALWTGSFWGKPTWGTYWIWDARLTSELILLFLYLGFISLNSAIDDPRRASRASALLALVGIINIPIIYFSVKWWNTLHQGMSVTVDKAPTMATSMFTAMMLLTFAFWLYTIAVALMRVRNIILERESQTAWVQDLVKGKN
ncbi:MAG: heme ABC transporter permease [Candidatus Heimdallarchaeota archaeon]|nr:heme ABC transporter permease [Gammaproteobacteria bacterium]MDH5647719.1 heme ABC transporter permease [Candidatus Heimdallarchaeota archaeon]MDH5730889.1 heme ABC transporter permease [Gammaproteobacteria bacterium]